jgi:hypothetical protein
MARVISKGTCSFCKSEIAKNTVTQHLKHCKARTAAIAAETESVTKDEQGKLFHIVVEGEYNPQYWMHLEVSASAMLADLDAFLRDIWLECCGHLSAFNIGTTEYSSEPEEFPFFADSQAENNSDTESKEEKDVNEVEEVIDSLLSALLERLPPDMLAGMKKCQSTYDLVDFLRQEMATFTPPRGIHHIQEQRDRFLLWTMLEQLIEQLDDRGMDIPLEKVLKVGQKFSYEYDFGSTTELKLKVVSERAGVLVQNKDDEYSGMALLARNVPPVIPCCVCEKPAKMVEPGYYSADENGYCSSKCAKKKGGEYDYDEMLPVVNSPRVGVCAYSG